MRKAPVQLHPLKYLEKTVPARGLCPIRVNGTLESTSVTLMCGGTWISPSSPDRPREGECVDLDSMGTGVAEIAVGVKKAANIKGDAV